MGGRFDIVRLAGDQVARALPVVQATWPEVDLETWRRFVAGYEDASGQGEILALCDAGRTLCGLLAYRWTTDLPDGTVLSVSLFTAVDLANSPYTIRALLDAAETVAAERRCTRIEIRLHGEQAELAARLRYLGLSSGATLLRLDLPPLRPAVS